MAKAKELEKEEGHFGFSSGEKEGIAKREGKKWEVVRMNKQKAWDEWLSAKEHGEKVKKSDVKMGET